MKKHYSENQDYKTEDNPFALSSGDLMAGFLFIFILLLMSTLLQVQKKAEQDENIVNKYNNIKTQLYIDLKKEFEQDLILWNATIDSSNLSFKFQEGNTNFDYDQSVLQDRFKKILDSFFPRYLKTISSDRYRNNIVEIRIEGHTDSQGSYEYNMKLSQDRTRSVLNYCMLMVNPNQKNWVKAHLTANGLSSSHLIYNKDGSENAQLSRRVEFRIITNAEEQLKEIIRKRNLK